MGKLKKKSYKILSDKKCITCGKNLKQNLVDKNPEAEYCFEHYPKSKKNMASASLSHQAKNNGDNSMAIKKEISLVVEARAAIPYAENEVEAMDMYAQKLHKELRELVEVGKDSGKEYNAKKRKYRKVRDEYLGMRDEFIEEESSMEIKSATWRKENLWII